MNTTNPKYVVGIVLGALILLGAFLFINTKLNGTPTADAAELKSLAMCIKSSGATFYGAFWCPHCAATKRMFGSAAEYLPYHECSTADAKGQLKDCTDKGVKGYPTWVFADGTRLEGESTLQTLALRTGCPFSDGADATTTSTTGGSSSAVSGPTPTTTATASSTVSVHI